jgi:uncharacterized membrane protein
MADEETVEQEPETPPAPDKPGSEHGFRFGLLVGIIAGALIAMLLARDANVQREPKGEEELGEAETPIATLRAALSGVRERMQDASREAEAAAREVEERLSARYDELTKN